MRRSAWAAVALTLAVTMPTARAAQTPKPNLQSNPEAITAAGYTLSAGAVFDAAVSRGAGGSIRLPRNGQSPTMWGPPTPVVAGRTYTLSAFLRSDSAVSDNVIMWPVRVTATGGFIALDRDLAFQAVSVKDTWQEVSLSYSSTTTGFVAVFACRCEPIQFTGSGNLWLDDLAIFEGPAVQVVDPGVRRGFAGGQTRVDELGNISVLDNGTWIDWFPFCVAANANRTPAQWRRLAEGFDCNIWSWPSPGELSNLTNARTAGMRSFVQVAQYLKGGTFAGRWAHLAQTIKDVNASAEAPYVAGWWHDNEVADTIENYRALYDTIRATDGARRPIVMLQSHAYARAFGTDGSSWADVLGSYYHDQATAWSAQRIPSGVPRSMCQINNITSDMRLTVMACIANGGRMLSVFRDGTAPAGNYANPANPPPVDTNSWWPDMPALRTRVAAMMGFVKAPESARWRLTTPANNDIAPVTISTRDVDGFGQTLMVNRTATAKLIDFTAAAAPYSVGEIRDYATNALLASPAGASTWTLTVPPLTALHVRLIPDANAATSTTTSSTSTTSTSSTTASTTAKPSAPTTAAPTHRVVIVGAPNLRVGQTYTVTVTATIPGGPPSAARAILRGKP